jgi:hypothetical protein
MQEAGRERDRAAAAADLGGVAASVRPTVSLPPAVGLLFPRRCLWLGDHYQLAVATRASILLIVLTRRAKGSQELLCRSMFLLIYLPELETRPNLIAVSESPNDNSLSLHVAFHEMSVSFFFQLQDTAAVSTKPAKRYPLALWIGILGLIMLVAVYIFSLSLKQNGMLFGLMQTNLIEKEREKPCHDPSIPDTEIPYLHYPMPNTYDR